MCILNKFVLNVLSNCIPHKIILCDDKDPPGFNSRIKSLFNAKNKAFKIIKNKTNIQLLNKLKLLKERLNDLITKSKNNYYKPMTNKPNNLQRNSKVYWSLRKCFFKQQKNTLNFTTVSRK